MVLGTGIDIIQVSRVEKAILNGRHLFLKRVFTPREIEYCENKVHKYQHYAVRFAAKEASLKALGTGWQNGIEWTDIEVENTKSGKPKINLSGKAELIAREMTVINKLISLSHYNEYAVAQVIFESAKIFDVYNFNLNKDVNVK